MDARSGKPPQSSPQPDAAKPGRSFRGEVALAALVVAIYAAVFSTSLFSLAGGDSPDLLQLREEPQPANVSEVLGAQSEQRPAATAAPQPAAPQPQPRISPTQVPAQPVAPQPSPAAQPRSAPSRPAASVSGQHLVTSGQTLSLLSVLYRVEVDEIKRVNGLQSDVIYAGQTLIVPRPDEASRIGVPSLGEGGGGND